jgi:hypothetical protein
MDYNAKNKYQMAKASFQQSGNQHKTTTTCLSASFMI